MEDAPPEDTPAAAAARLRHLEASFGQVLRSKVGGAAAGGRLSCKSRRLGLHGTGLAFRNHAAHAAGNLADACHSVAISATWVPGLARAWHPATAVNSASRPPAQGSVWIATRPDLCGEWSQAGGILRLAVAGPWFALVPRAMWPTDPAQLAMIEKVKRPRAWPPAPHGAPLPRMSACSARQLWSI